MRPVSGSKGTAKRSQMAPARYRAILIGPLVALAIAAPSQAHQLLVKLPRSPAERTGWVRTEPDRALSATAGFAYVNSGGLLLARAYYDSAGGAVSADHSGTGQYLVTFNNLGFPGGDVQVTSFTGLTCTVGSWGPVGRDLKVSVGCYNQFNTAVDSGFEVLVTQARRHVNGVLDYDWVYHGRGALTGGYQYNSSHKVNSVRHPATGQYVVTMPGPGLKGASQGTVKVSPYGLEGGSCQVANWRTTRSGEQITVHCFTAGGAPQNRRFDIVYTRGNNLMGQNGKTTANALANSGSVTYRPKLQFDSQRGAHITVLHLDRGFYEAVFIGSNTTANANGGSGNIQVTPVSTRPRICSVQPILTHTPVVFIDCSDAARLNPADTAFTLQFVVIK